MSFHIRKSIKIGPLRFNISKSGIGISSGVSGARISTGPRGTYIHMGRNGVYYRKKIDGSISTTQKGLYENNTTTEGETLIDSIRELIELTNTELVAQINTRIHQPTYALLIAAVSLIFTCIFMSVGFSIQYPILRAVIAIISFTFLIVGVYFAWVTDQQENLMRTATLQYNLEADTENKFNELVNALSNLALSTRIWRVTSQKANWDWKRNAGASSLITRKKITSGAIKPPFLQTQFKVYGFALGQMDLFFLPDQVFVYQSGKYRVIPYSSLQVTAYPSRYIENEGVPTDSNIVDYTWQYVRVDGGPDRRFSNNKQIPIVQYGHVEFSSQSGINIHFQVSNLLFAQQFAQMLSSYINFTINPNKDTSNQSSSNQEKQSKGKPEQKPQGLNAYTKLNVSSDASKDEITSAYKKLAQQYHPDKVEGLGPEFKELAEKRMKDINAAYKEIMRKFKE